ncbi:MAG: serine hydrolase domain-containing protein [Nannocystaceae bacterium]
MLRSADAPRERSEPAALVPGTITALASAFACALACSPGRADPHACSDADATSTCRRDAPLAGEYPAADDVILEWLAEDDAPPGCGLGVVVDGAIVHLRGLGLADRRRGRPYTLATLGALGSVSKTITAIALHRLLAARGPEGPSLDQPLGELLPAIPELLADVPLRALLNHSAGLESLLYGEAYPRPYLDDEALGRLFEGEEHPTLWPRDTYWGLRERLVAGSPGTYANVNYHLVGAILDFYAIDGVDPATIRALDFDAAASGAFAGEGEAGYVAYTLEAVAHGASSPDDHLTSMCPRTPWMPELAALARGEGDDGEDATVAGFASGRIASGGWMMTVGDFARLVALLDREALVDRATLRANPTRINIGLGTDAAAEAGEGTWVMQQGLSGGLETPAIHHLGRVDGYTAYYRLTEAIPDLVPSIGVALLCNGRVKNSKMVSTTESIVDAVDRDLRDHGAPSRRADPALAGCDDT